MPDAGTGTAARPDGTAMRHAVAERIAAEAGTRALGFFLRRAELEIEAKANPQDVVSRADREVEDLIRARVATAFPDDGFWGEEGGERPGTSGFVWVIDPIDGTSPFLAGLPHWCVAIAILRDHETVAAVTFMPVSAEVFSARLGGGATLNGVPLLIAPGVRVGNSLTGLGVSHRTTPEHIAAVVGRLLSAGGVFYRNGSGASMLAYVAAGRLGGYYEPHMNAWDCLGGMLMVREAAGRTNDFAALTGMAAGDVVIATAAGVWDDLCAAIGPGTG